MVSFKAPLLVGIFALISTSVIAAPKKAESIEDLIQLKYGEPCNYEMEELRQNWTLTLINAMKEPGSLREKLTCMSEEMMTSILEKGEPICNAMSLLTCNKETSTCDCGDPGTFAVLGEEEGKTKFVKEDGNKCRWVPQSYCVPPDYMKKKYGSIVEVDVGCAKGTSCTNVNNGSPCSFFTMIFHAMSNGPDSLLNDMYTGAICTCQPDLRIKTIDEAEKDSSDNNDYNKYDVENTRRKRQTKNYFIKPPPMPIGFVPDIVTAVTGVSA